ncbi:hypothetical protein [Methylobacterium sp. B4]|uniref:hypothetical protein n=1 Tax=Methylobacterium sp. B4 TaxID=1938755 RepID=UPI0015E89AE1|nr:hypothetical protein [Methylobacterium sp. B4]
MLAVEASLASSVGAVGLSSLDALTLVLLDESSFRQGRRAEQGQNDVARLAARREPCGDLWNLFPASRRINQHGKRDRLPSAAALARAREPILTWWRMASDTDAALADRFWAEARTALPIAANTSYGASFSGLEWRRLRVSQDQQPPEWAGRT